MGYKVLLTETQLIKVIKEEHAQWAKSRDSISPYELEGNHIMSFENYYDRKGNQVLYWAESNIRLVDNELQLMLDTWLTSEPERFCTIEEFRAAYPRVVNNLWRESENHIAIAYMKKYGCMLIWSSKYGK